MNQVSETDRKGNGEWRGDSGEEVDGVEHMLKSIGWDVCLGLF